MAYFAKLNELNKVVVVHTVKDELLEDINVNQLDQNGINHLNSLLGFHSNWGVGGKGGGRVGGIVGCGL